MRTCVQYDADESSLPCEVIPKPGKVVEIALADGGTTFDLYAKYAVVIGFHDEVDLPLSGIAILRNGVVWIDVE